MLLTNLLYHVEQANITSPTEETTVDRERLVGGGSVTYTCVVEGVPPPIPTWYYNGGDLPEGVSMNGEELTISDPQVGQSGIYQSVITNRFGGRQFRDSRTWILEVREPGKEVDDYYFQLNTLISG